MTYSELPDAELRIAVARKLGWVECDYCSGWVPPNAGEHECLPDFPNSLDACDEVKKWLLEHDYRIDVFIRQGYAEVVILSATMDESYGYAEDEHAEPRALCLAFMEVEE